MGDSTRREIEAGSFERLHAYAAKILKVGPGAFHPLDTSRVACTWVGHGLTVAIANFDHELARSLLRCGIDLADDLLAREPRGFGLVEGAVPLEPQQVSLLKARCWHAKALGESFLANAPPAAPAILKSHRHYLQSLELTPAEYRKEFYLPELHGGAELCLGAGRTELAASLLEVPPPHEPCARRHAMLTGLVVAIRSQPRHGAAGSGESAVAGLFRSLRFGGKPPDWEDTAPLRRDDGAAVAFSRFYGLWRDSRGGDWIANPGVLDPIPPSPDQTLATVAHAFIADRFILGNALPDWRRVLAEAGA